MTVFFNGRSAIPKAAALTATSAPDVCKVPTPGGPPVPTPFVNVASSRDLANGTRRVLIQGQPIAVKDANLASSHGNEPGSIGGVFSNVTRGTTKWVSWSADVRLERRGAVRFLDPVLMNGNCNNTQGVVPGELFFDFQYAAVTQLACPACGDPLCDHTAADFPEVQLVDPAGMDGTCTECGHRPGANPRYAKAPVHCHLAVGRASYVGASGQDSIGTPPRLRNVFTGQDVQRSINEQVQAYRNSDPGATETTKKTKTKKKKKKKSGGQAPGFSTLGNCAEFHAVSEFLAANDGTTFDRRRPPRMRIACWSLRSGSKKNVRPRNAVTSPAPQYDLGVSYENRPADRNLRQNYVGPCATCQLMMAGVFCMRAAAPEHGGGRR